MNAGLVKQMFWKFASFSLISIKEQNSKYLKRIEILIDIWQFKKKVFVKKP